MISTKSKLAAALGIAGAIALSMSTAEARTKHSSAKARAAAQDTVVSGAGARVNQRSFGRSFNYDPGFSGGYNPGFTGGGINFRDGRGGANYNPNQ